jgi:hypothetical protein
MAASPQQQGQGGSAAGGGGWSPEQFWSLLDKADRRFARVRDLPLIGRQEPDAFAKAFRAYTQLWRMQQEHRHRLLDAGLRRWQVGEIASRIAHLYYAQYQRTADTALLSEAFVFYHAVLDRAYFLDADHHLTPAKHLRFLARFLLVALLLARRAHTVPRLAADIRALLDDSKKSFQVRASTILHSNSVDLANLAVDLMQFRLLQLMLHRAGSRIQGVEACRARDLEVSAS